MLHCKTVELLYDAVPVNAWRGFLIRRHMDRCPHCAGKLAGREEARALLAAPGDPQEWAGLRRRLMSIAENPGASAGRPERQAGRLLIWIPRAAMLCALVLAGFWLVRESRQTVSMAGAVGPAGRFELDYIRIGGQPASAYVYQPLGTEMIVIWAEKSL